MRNRNISVSKPYNVNIVRVLRLTREMIILADEGDSNRQDKSCGVLYGMLRDSAYKIKNLAEKEKDLHIKNEIWDLDEQNEIAGNSIVDK
jgi:hypothetical protein